MALRPLLTKQIRETLLELSQFFAKLTATSLTANEVQALQEGVVIVLCKLERIFPPAFFTVMVHLCVHLPKEALLGGPVHSRWMYPIERYLGHLKKYVRNRARREGSIAEGYIVEEAMTFSCQYLRGIESKFSTRLRTGRETINESRTYSVELFRPVGRSMGKKNLQFWHSQQLEKAKWFVLNNCTEIESYLG